MGPCLEEGLLEGLSRPICAWHLGECGDRWDAQWAPPPPPRRASGSPLSPSEGSIIAYYWSEFSIPTYLVEEAERAMAEERVVTLPPRARTFSSFVLTSVVAFREYRDTRVGICWAHLWWSRARPWTVGGTALPSQCTCWPGTSL